MIVQFLEDLSDALLRPRELAMVYTVEKRGLGTALATVVLVGITMGFTISIPIPWLVGGSEGLKWLGLSAMASGVLAAFTTSLLVILWLLHGLLVHAGLSLVGGRGDFSTTLSLVGTSYVCLWPLVVLPPVTSLLAGGLGGFMLGFLIGGVIGLPWAFYSQVVSLAEGHGVNMARVVIAMLLSLLILVSVTLLILLLL